MSLQDQNKMLQILHKNGVSRKNVAIIMEDLKVSGVFDDKEEEYSDDSWDLMDQQADILFSDMDPKDKISEIKRIESEILEKNNIPATVRISMGSDIGGACGQLRRKHK